jgi:hypothetical protein
MKIIKNILLPKIKNMIKKRLFVGHQWLTSLILATQEAEIRRIKIRSQPGQIVHETLSLKNLHK